MKKYETLCFKEFNKVYLFSKREITSIKKRTGIEQINFGIDKIVNKFKYKKQNNRIIFVGNIKYLPNKLACKYFIKKILPKILIKDPKIEFHIIGEISLINNFFWKFNKSVKIHGKKNNLSSMLNRSFCALANLNVASGIQTKILTYMSLGIPCIASYQVLKNFDAIKSNFIPVYKNDDDLINLIFKIKNNRRYSENISKKNISYVKRFKWTNIFKKLRNF